MNFLSVAWPIALAVLWGIVLTLIQSKIRIPQAIAPLYLILAVGPAVLAIYYAMFNIPNYLTYENAAWLLGIAFVVSLVHRFITRFFISNTEAHAKKKTIRRPPTKHRG